MKKNVFLNAAEGITSHCSSIPRPMLWGYSSLQRDPYWQTQGCFYRATTEDAGLKTEAEKSPL